MLFARAAVAVAFVWATPFLAITSISAKPVLTITLAQTTVVTGTDGTIHLIPLDGGTPLAHDAVIRYTVNAKNASAEPARHLALTGHVPDGTALVPSSVRGIGGHAEFSLDGKSFSPRPLIETKTPAGTVMVPADPALYVLVRWVKDAPLAPESSTSFSYDVHLK